MVGYSFHNEKDIIVKDNSEINGTIIVKHNISNEEITISKIVRKGNTLSYNIAFNNKVYRHTITVSDYTLSIEKPSGIIKTVVRAVVSMLWDDDESALSECRQAFQSLNCPQGTRPFMEFSTGWFSTTCNIGCI